MDKGWIKLHRGILDEPVWIESTSEQKVLLLTLLMTANGKEKQWVWKGEHYTVRPGQLVTSLPSLVQKCGKGSSVQKIRTALKKFEQYGFLTDESTNQNRLITIVNWSDYQTGERSATTRSTGDRQNTDRQQETNRQGTDDEQATSIRLTSIKNLRSLKNLKKNKKKTNRRKQIYDKTSIFYQLAVSLFENIKQNHSGTKEPDFQKWANEFRLIVERDERTAKQVKHLIKWSQQHTFWHTVILSPASLRRNWDQLASQAKQERVSANRPVPLVPEWPVENIVLDFAAGEEA